MSMKKNLINKRFGNLIVISEHHSDGKHLYWLCECNCGNVKVICGDSLKRGATKSCGCLNKKLVSNRRKIHGETGTRLYNIWTGMIYRCENKNATGYEFWGGKGIKVCDKWRKDFLNFKKWALENGYEDDLTIDRINPNKNYCPENSKKVKIDNRNFGVI